MPRSGGARAIAHRPAPRVPAGAARVASSPRLSKEGASREDASRSHDVPEGGSPGYSAEVLLRRKPFDECTDADLDAMERLLARAAPRLATRRSRRLVPSRGRGLADLRRSFRRAVATGGELVDLARRSRAVEEPRLVVLCDTSGSMDRHTRFLLAFVMGLKRVARRTEVFVFNTSLTRVTRALSTGSIGPVLERLAERVPDWFGGTRIGECLSTFVDEFGYLLVPTQSVVVILSDGLDRGDTSLVAGAVAAIRARARRLIWLNPLAGDPRYEPTARAMQAALPFIDRLVPAHNLESLERLLPDLAA